MMQIFFKIRERYVKQQAVTEQTLA